MNAIYAEKLISARVTCIDFFLQYFLTDPKKPYALGTRNLAEYFSETVQFIKCRKCTEDFRLFWFSVVSSLGFIFKQLKNKFYIRFFTHKIIAI